MAEMLDSEEAARHLGVKVSTLYAYVSRGVLVSHPVPGSRRRRFAREDLDRLSGRSRPARADDTRLATVVTAVTQIHAEGPYYRGQLVGDLLGRRTFEEVAALLWGETADPKTADAKTADPETADPKTADPERWVAVELDQAARAVLATLPDGDALRAAVVLAGAADPFRGDERPPALARAARRMVATVLDALPRRGGGRRTPALVVDGRRVPGTAAQRLTTSLTDHPPSGALVRAVNAAMVTMADHELATSTVAARVAASTRADLYAVALSALGAMSGRLHAGASDVVRPLFDDARWQGGEEALGRALRASPRLPGFGHRLYPEGDPRAPWLLEWVRPLAGPERRRAIDELLGVAADAGLPPPNVDFALGALAWAGDLVPGASVTLATVARLAGWVAHALEEYREPPLRFRARAVYRAGE